MILVSINIIQDHMKVKVYTINAFAKAKQGGNPAGVVLDADQLSEGAMKKIAKIIGFSETAFIMKSNKADFKIRFFTPNEEVDLCGHATIAAFSVLLKTECINPGTYTQETKAGILAVEVDDNGIIMMTQSNPSFYEIIDYEEIADTLDINVDDFNRLFPCQIVSTGLKDILIPISNIEILDTIKPNFEKVAKLSKKYDVIGYHMFVLDSVSNSNAYCRNLAPLYGIDEESATGTSSGALACYLYKYGVFDTLQCHNITFEQGYSMNMPSEINVKLNVKESDICEVKVGGKALNIYLREVEI